MKLRTAFLGLAVSPVALLAGGAQAQDDSLGLNAQAADLFARDQNIGVRERPHPEYEANGMRLGAFLLYPRIDASVEFNDNIYATDVDEQSDTIFRVAPTVTLSSDWNRHALQFTAGGSFQRYSDHSLENTDDYNVGANGRLDLQRFWNATGYANYARISEPRIAQNTPFASAEPIMYDLTRVGAGTQKTFDRIRLGLNVDWARYNYDNGRTIGTPAAPSVVIDQDVRDRDTVDFTVRGDYAISPDTAVFVLASTNKRTYDIGSTALYAARDSKGYQVLAGADFQVTNLITGNLAFGYLEQNFDDSRFKDISGLGGKVSLEWFPTQLTTVSGTISRTVEDSVQDGAGGFLSTNVVGQVDHELLRNVILTGQVGYGKDEFGGVDRNDTRWLGALSGTYLLNRYIGIGLSYSYLDQTSRGLDRGREFTVQRATVSLVLQR